MSPTATSDRSTSPNTGNPSGPAVYIDHDTQRRHLTLLVDERSEVTGDYFVARAGPNDCDASSCEDEDLLDHNAPVRHVRQN